MSSSPEYETIVNCTVGLEIIFKGCESSMVHFLRREGFIREAVSDDVLDPRSMLTQRDKAGRLVEGIRDAVFLNKDMFHTLLNHLRTCGKYYSSTVDSLSKELVKLGGVVQQTKMDGNSHQNNGIGEFGMRYAQRSIRVAVQGLLAILWLFLGK